MPESKETIKIKFHKITVEGNIEISLKGD